MERLTSNNGGIYTVSDTAQAVEKLGKLEDMYSDMRSELSKSILEMNRLSESGKSKSVTYKQLFAKKLTLMNYLSRFELYCN